jgi:hypothetical protein
MKAGILQIGVCLLVLSMSEVSSGQAIDYGAFRDRVFKAVESGEVDVAEPHLDWEGDVLAYSLGAFTDRDPQDPFSIPFSEMLRIAAIRKYQMQTAEQRKVWKKAIPEVEQRIKKMVDLVNSTRISEEELDAQLNTLSSEIEKIYHKHLSDWASTRNMKAFPVDGAAALPEITIRNGEQSSMQAKYMSAGAYLMHLTRHKKEPNFEDTKWTPVARGGTISVGAKTCIYARWADGQEYLIKNLEIEGSVLVITKNGFDWQ